MPEQCFAGTFHAVKSRVQNLGTVKLYLHIDKIGWYVLPLCEVRKLRQSFQEIQVTLNNVPNRLVWARV